MSNSIWVDVPGHPRYKVSPEGRVLSLINRRLLKNMKNNNGYAYVHLDKDTVFLHQLVAKLFVPGQVEGKEINHIDGNKMNAHYENLEWVTRRENIIHSIKVLGKKFCNGERCHTAKVTEEIVRAIRKEAVKGKSKKPIAAKYGLDLSTVYDLIKGNSWKHVK